MIGRSGNFDVIVIGGGPAGSASAIACSKRGLRTLLIEAMAQSINRPGETLHPGVENLFCTLGVDLAINNAGFLRHSGYSVKINSDTLVYRYGFDDHRVWLGYQAKRPQLDEILLHHALAAGVVISRPERAIHFKSNNSAKAELVTSRGTYSAAFIVDASGSAHWLRRQLRLPLFRVSKALLAYYGWIDATPDLLPQRIPIYEMRDCAWSWIAPVSENQIAWVCVDISGQRARLPLPQSPLGQLTKNSRSRCADVTWRIVLPCAGHRYFLVGDAASLLDPASSHGILKAIMSAELAADCIYQILRQNAHPRNVQVPYCDWVRKWFCSDATSLMASYSHSVPPPDWLNSASDVIRYISMYRSA